jgi:hypothetical protein
MDRSWHNYGRGEHKVSIPNDNRKADLLKRMGKYGEKAAEGYMSRHRAALDACQSAYDNVVGPDDAQALWQRFQEGNANALKKTYIREPSFKVQVSKFKVFLLLGSKPDIDGPAVLTLAMECIENMASSDPKSLKPNVYECLNTVAVAQNKSPDEFGEDEIYEVLQGKAKKPKDEASVLKSVQRTLEKLIEGKGEVHAPTPQAMKALEAVDNRLAELGAQESATSYQQTVDEALPNGSGDVTFEGNDGSDTDMQSEYVIDMPEVDEDELAQKLASKFQ